MGNNVYLKMALWTEQKLFFSPQVEPSHGKMQNMAEAVTTVLLEMKKKLICFKNKEGAVKNDRFFIYIKNFM